MEGIIGIIEVIVAILVPFILQWFKNAGYDLKGIRVQLIILGIAVAITLVAALVKGFAWWVDVPTIFALIGIIQMTYGLIVKNITNPQP